MIITRHAPAGARRTWFRPAPWCLPGTAADPDAAPAQRPGGKQVARITAAIVAIAALAAVGVAVVAGRAAVAASFTVLGHLHWLWIPAAVLLESASMAAFAIMLRRLLAAGGTRVGIRPMLATVYAANAVSVSVPLAGPTLATAFTFRRFTRQRHRTAPRPTMQPGRSCDPPAPRHAPSADRPAQRTAQKQDTRHDR